MRASLAGLPRVWQVVMIGMAVLLGVLFADSSAEDLRPQLAAYRNAKASAEARVDRLETQVDRLSGLKEQVASLRIQAEAAAGAARTVSRLEQSLDGLRNDLRSAQEDARTLQHRARTAERALATTTAALEKARGELAAVAPAVPAEEPREAQEPDLGVGLGDCHPSYSGVCVPITSDVDCAGGSGNGPEYTDLVTIVGPDEYGLDPDGDGLGCE